MHELYIILTVFKNKINVLIFKAYIFRLDTNPSNLLIQQNWKQHLDEIQILKMGIKPHQKNLTLL